VAWNFPRVTVERQRTESNESRPSANLLHNLSYAQEGVPAIRHASDGFFSSLLGAILDGLFQEDTNSKIREELKSFYHR
jgi:hypothetical protein